MKIAAATVTSRTASLCTAKRLATRAATSGVGVYIRKQLCNCAAGVQAIYADEEGNKRFLASQVVFPAENALLDPRTISNLHQHIWKAPNRFCYFVAGACEIQSTHLPSDYRM